MELVGWVADMLIAYSIIIRWVMMEWVL